jgi:hypothetical protein
VWIRKPNDEETDYWFLFEGGECDYYTLDEAKECLRLTGVSASVVNYHATTLSEIEKGFSQGRFAAAFLRQSDWT